MPKKKISMTKKRVKDEKHADMINAYIEMHEKYSGSAIRVNFEYEVPFNYYGNRGWVDLVQHQSNDITMLIEFKTKLLDIGETLRQYKNMKEFYPKYKPAKPPREYISQLIILDTHENREIFFKNKRLFKGINVVFFDMKKGLISPARAKKQMYGNAAQKKKKTSSKTPERCPGCGGAVTKEELISTAEIDMDKCTDAAVGILSGLRASLPVEEAFVAVSILYSFFRSVARYRLESKDDAVQVLRCAARLFQESNEFIRDTLGPDQAFARAGAPHEVRPVRPRDRHKDNNVMYG